MLHGGNHEGDNVGGILRPVQRGAGALVDLLATGAAAEAPVFLRGSIGPLCSALERPDAAHPIRLVTQGQRYTRLQVPRSSLARTLMQPGDGA
jgi:hypothetical protein